MNFGLSAFVIGIIIIVFGILVIYVSHKIYSIAQSKKIGALYAVLVFIGLCLMAIGIILILETSF